MRTFDLTRPNEGEQAALLHNEPKRKRSWNPFHYLWIAWENFAYFWAPANQCQYCWVLRMFILGILVGIELLHWFPWIRIW